MRIETFLFTALAVIGDPEACAGSPVDLMLLVDCSTYSIGWHTNFATQMSAALEAATERWPLLRVAVADFSDKPAPYVGVGLYGGYPDIYATDRCYKLQAAFGGFHAQDPSYVDRALASLDRLSGLDIYDSNFEALVRGLYDSTAGWSQTSESQKVVLMLTDTFGHAGMDFNALSYHVNLFNDEIYCADGYSTGGFGAMSPHENKIGWSPPNGNYEEFAELMYKGSCSTEDPALTDDEEERAFELYQILSPPVYPVPKEFDLEVLQSDPEYHCKYHEYPNYTEITTLVNAKDTKVLIIQIDEATTRATVQETWNWALNADEALAGLQTYYEHVPTNDGDSLREALLAGMEALVECNTTPVCEGTDVTICPCEDEAIECHCCEAAVELDFALPGPIGKLNLVTRQN